MPTVTRRVAKKPGQPGWHSEEQKLQAFTLWLALGNLSEVGQRLDIPYKTIQKWKYSDWWKNQYKELEQGNKLKLGTKVSNILDKCGTNLEDRLDNGNFFYNRETKTLERRPLTTKEVVDIMRAATATQELVDKANANFIERDNREARAAELTGRLERIAKMLEGPKEPPQIIDVEVIEEKHNGIFQESV